MPFSGGTVLPADVYLLQLYLILDFISPVTCYWIITFGINFNLKWFYNFFYFFWISQYFRGIPYAKPPTGSLRWADPEPLRGSLPGGRLDATQYKSFCPQFDHDKNTVVGNEDCLYLNVFTPGVGSLGQLRFIFCNSIV